MKKLRENNISEDLVNTIEWLYAQTKIRVGKEHYNVGRGVIQGGVLSPTLFIIMFNDLIEELERNNLKIFAYADDLAVTGITR